MRLYLCGPMSGIEALNFPLFHAETARLRAAGHDVVNPAEVNPDPGMAWAECLRRDIPHLLTCEAIALLPGWERSRGATLERHIAEQLGMRVCMAADFPEQGLPTNVAAELRSDAERLVARAWLAHHVLTVEQVPVQPLAMGRYETVVSVRPARKPA